MGQSLVKNYLHITFSTKNRYPFILHPVENELYAYIAKICMDKECYPVQIGGYTDHIHILCQLSKKIALMDLLEEIKSSSSKWIKSKGTGYESFYWQNGYAAFSVSQSQLNVVTRYIENQKEHHKNLSFENELRALLKKYQIDFDERYVWD